MQAQDSFQKPEFVQAAIQRGMALFNEGRFDSAETVFAMAAPAPDTRHFVQHMRGLIAERLGRREEAKSLLREAIELRPEIATAHANLGSILLEEGQAAHAVAAFAAALGLKPDSALNHFSLACALEAARQPALAVASYRDALALQPDYSEAEINLARLLIDLGRPEEGAEGLRRALERRPDSLDLHTNLALCLLAMGDWAAGWREYEWRWSDPRLGQDPLLAYRPRWRGEELAGKTLLLQAEQGFGDSLQFLRYARLLQDKGGRLLLRLQPRLLALMAGQSLFDGVSSAEEPPPPFDFHAPLMSLPHLLGGDFDAVPPPLAPAVEPDRADRWRRRLDARFGAGGGLKVGLCWQGNPAQQRDRARSIPLDRLAPLFGHPGLRLVSLQVEHGAEQQAPYGDQLFDAGAEMDPDSFADAVALIEGLDLVITIDSAIAHLAGSLGRPVWVLLSTEADWRWPRGRDTTPWYPSARLFHQTEPGGWAEMVDAVATALAELAPGWDTRPSHSPARRSAADGILADSLFVEGCRHHEAGTFDRARQFYDAALGLDPDHRETLCNFAALLTDEEEFDRARELAERAVRLAPRRAVFRRILADTLRRSDSVAAAVATYRRALELEPEDAAAHAGLALALRAAGDLDKALGHFQRAAELDERQSPDFFQALGDTLIGLDRLEGAERALRHALSLDSSLAPIHCGLGTLLLKTERPDEAEASFRAALAVDPLSAQAHIGLGDCTLAQGDVAAAKSHWRDAEQLDPQAVRGRLA